MQEFLYVFVVTQNEDGLIRQECVIGTGQGLQLAVVLGGQDVDAILLPDRQLHHGLAHPAGGHCRLKDGVLRR